MPVLMQPALTIKILAREAEVVVQFVDDGVDLAEGFEFAVPDYCLLLIHQELGSAEVVGEVVESAGLGVGSCRSDATREHTEQGAQGGQADSIFGGLSVDYPWIGVICQVFCQIAE
ncbi:MAG: hypothetical protein OEV64_15070, partial [Desulfobulbaceae bacterium]|nr:hypothetical protein [Desulfobulbaceae bacterium]